MGHKISILGGGLRKVIKTLILLKKIDKEKITEKSIEMCNRNNKGEQK